MSCKLMMEKPESQKRERKESKQFLYNNTETEQFKAPHVKNAMRFFRKPKIINEPIKLYSQQPRALYVEEYVPKPTPIPEAIRQIDRKIRQYKQLMQAELKLQQMKEQLERQQAEQAEQEQEEVKKEGYDYLTNPQLLQEQPDEEEIDDNPDEDDEQELPLPTVDGQKTIIQQEDTNSYSTQAMKREQIHQHQLERLYDKRQNPGLYAKLKKKAPKLGIISKYNTIKSSSMRVGPDEHKMRIYNRENVPCVPEVIIPSFPVKKDFMAQNILAYLKEYTPLFRGMKNFEYPKCVKNILQEEIEAIQKN